MKKIYLLVGLLTFVGGLAQVDPEPMNFVHRKLANGLNVVSLRDNSTPSVAINLYYDVGSKDDPQGRSGFAHMFEHMMFKSTKNMQSEMLDRLTEDVGGFNNASTRDDFTNYFEVVPSHYLETLIWAEADRMVNLNVDEQNFSSERDVVKEEFRQRVLSNPYGMLFGQYFDQLSFDVHPYKRPGIGNLEELSAATVADANSFYKTYYRPDNAWLIVVGDFDQKQFDSYVDKYFGAIAKPSEPLKKRNMPVEPERTKEVRHYKTAPTVPFPAVLINYLAPPSKSEDVPALKIAEVIMASGESSRLYQSLVYEQKIAQQADFSADIRVDKGLIYLLAIATEGTSPETLEKALLTELAQLQQTPVSAKELEKAKNRVITQILNQRETNRGKASALESAIAYHGDPAAANQEIAKLQAVTAADIQRVVNKYISDTNRVVIYYQQNEKN